MSWMHPFLWTQTSSNQDKMRRGLSCLYTANARNLPTFDNSEDVSFRQTLFPVLICFYPLSCKTIYSPEHKLSSISKKRRLHISRHSSMIFAASFHNSVYFKLLQSFPLQTWPASPPVWCCKRLCEPPSLNLHKRTSGGTRDTRLCPQRVVPTPCSVRGHWILILSSVRVPATAFKLSTAIHLTGNDS